MTHHHRLTLRLFRIGLISGIGAGVALLVYSRTGFGALLGDVGFYLLLAGAGWFTGQAVGTALSLEEPRRLRTLSAVFALAYAGGVDPLDTLLVEVSLTGAWLWPSLWLCAVCAGLAGVLAWFVRPARAFLAACIGVLAMAAIVAAVNLIVWIGLRQGSGGAEGLALAGIWAIYLVPALWLPAVTYFCLKPLPQKA